AAAAAVDAAGGEAVVAPCDVAIEAEVARAVERVLTELGPPDLVVNNAGIVHRGPRVDETDPADWDRVIAVNLRGPFLVARAFVPVMRARGRGRLVHVASISSTIGCANNASYAASKWGLVGLAKSLAEELRGTGVVSCAVLPGSVDTEMLAGSGFPPQMTADDVAATIVWLGFDAPDAVHGSAVEMFG
ncbi:MAG TPA: SDR family oxidoreductase, partial [Minicystis sp.]|nr:SDR family oxidoreductase [Minicystis sp.]